MFTYRIVSNIIKKLDYSSIRGVLLLLLGHFGALLATTNDAYAWDEGIDSIMRRDPNLPSARAVAVFPARLRALLLEALDKPEADLRRQAALDIALAHQRGMKGLEAAIPALVHVLEQPHIPAAVRLATAQALVQLDAVDAAPALLREARNGDAILRNVIEPALVRWDYLPARTLWRERLRQPHAERGSLTHAMNAVAALHDEQAIPALLSLAVAHGTPAPVRLAAARALGEIRATGFESDAAQLLHDFPAQDIAARLAAAALLRRHSSGKAVSLLQELSHDAEPAVAAAALGRLIELDSQLAVPLVDRLVANPDAQLRSLGVETLRRQPSEKHICLLANLLDDSHPEVRIHARSALRQLAGEPMYQALVAREGMRTLAAREWRGQEQAAILIAQLRHESAAKRLLELLSSDRPEVFVAAAWGLRQLAVAETLPAVLEFFRSHWNHPVSRGSAGTRLPEEAVDQQLSQLAQFLGQTRYHPAEATLRQLIARPPVPARSPGPESRSAAIWALGLLHEGRAAPDLVRALEGRLHDVGTINGDEDPRVRSMAAISLGRMNATAGLKTLRAYWLGKLTLDPVNSACGWALAQISGEVFPQVGTVEITYRDWCVIPVESTKP